VASVAPRAPSEPGPRGSARRAGGRARAAAPRARRRRRLQVLAFLSPWLIGFGLFFAYPLAATIYFSFTRYNLFTLEYVGLDNYRFLVKDTDAWKAMRNTLWLVVIVVPLRVLFGLGIAQLLTKIKRGGNLLRSVFYLPYLIPPVSATVAFVFVLNPGTGPVQSQNGSSSGPAPSEARELPGVTARHVVAGVWRTL